MSYFIRRARSRLSFSWLANIRAIGNHAAAILGLPTRLPLVMLCHACVVLPPSRWHNPAFEPTRTGMAQLPAISFWVKCAMPARAAQHNVRRLVPQSHRTTAAVKTKMLVTAGFAVAAIVLSIAWLTSQYHHSAEIEVAERFVGLLRSGEYIGAYELTMKERMHGLRGEPFESYAQRQFCGNFGRSEVFPYQSNGNRLRRQLTGT